MRILCFGDSFTYGVGMPDYVDQGPPSLHAYPQLLAEHFKTSALNCFKQKNKAVEFSENDYILSLDADEALTNELKEQILDFKKSPKVLI